ncbi:hypothetical protein EW146_g9379 [Bondarzewia mesenterica]|uniref:Uncharacterized protein n=1 Tax=Bondarzewia mesenterica TaxID=1095465 RepID=A0A4S4L7B7_9AGAM|nr:hypothetical protein EW146_g9379 [Bondarzewia mesenterica]
MSDKDHHFPASSSHATNDATNDSTHSSHNPSWTLKPCPQCNSSVKNVPYHVRTTHQISVEVTYLDQSALFNVVRNADTQNFHCGRCGKGYRDPVSLKSHANKCTFVADARNSLELPDPHDLDPITSPASLQTPHSPVRSLALRRSSLELPLDLPPMFSPKPSKIPGLHPDGESMLPYKESKYFREPDAHTVVLHPRFNLPALGIVINTKYKVVICISCHHAISVTTIATHIKQHGHAVKAPAMLSATLAEEYGIVDGPPPFPRDRPPPIFGIEVEEEVFYFCGRCERGYRNVASLRAHQNSPERCPRSEGEENHSFHGYAQTFRLTSCLLLCQRRPSRTSAVKVIDPAKILLATLLPPDDFSKTPLTAPAHNLDLSTFLHRVRRSAKHSKAGAWQGSGFDWSLFRVYQGSI